MRIAIVHDFLNQFGGAERVVLALHELFPDAPIFTSIYDKERMPVEFRDLDIRTTFMQRLPGVMKKFKLYLPFYPAAFERMDLSGFDVILSSSSAFAKGIKKPEGALHICYCYNPMRFVWRYGDYIRDEKVPRLIKALLPIYLRRLKMWDVRTSIGVDHFISISHAIRDRILKSYGRDSAVIYPPVETQKFCISPVVDEYYLIVSRLKAYKRIDIAIEAFNKMGKGLKIIGSGEHEEKLRQIAGPTIEFLGKMDDKRLAQYYSRCRALIFPGEEDFGIVPVEAMASGRPVVAYAAGGALETVKEGSTGVFFNDPTSGSIINAVKELEAVSFDPNAIRRHAMSFDKEIFKQKIKEFVEARVRDRGR